MSNQSSMVSAIVQCSPSIALLKYWGKTDSKLNLPATPSLAVTLSELKTETRAMAITSPAEVRDLVLVNNTVQDPTRFEACFDALRRWLGTDQRFWIESTNNFPTAAGLASSSSGFAALVYSAALAAGATIDLDALSAIARIGSASAARSLYGGFTLLAANAVAAEVLHEADYWPDLRVIIVRVQDQAKSISSRAAMERTKTSSPYFPAWVEDAQRLSPLALAALANRDLAELGHYIQLSYLRMFGTMLAADPPILYWLPDSVALVRLCADLRAQGLAAWETMDAGPQVKIFCQASQVDLIRQTISHQFPHLATLVDKPGSGPHRLLKAELLQEPHQLIQQTAASLGLKLP